MAMNPRLLRPLASGYRYASLRKGLVAYWPMNETAASGDVLVGDETGRGNHLGSVNSVLSATGKIGNGREFTAANSEYLTAAGANTDLKFADGRDWTYAGWIYVSTWTNGLIWTGNDASGNREMLANLSTVRTRSLGFELNPGGAAGVNVIAGDALALNTWHFFAFTYTHSTGVLVGRINDGAGNNTISGTRSAGSLVQSANPLNLGRRQFTGANAHFGGLLDEVAKWDRVLTSAELDTLYNNGNGIDLSAPRKTFAPFPGVSNAETLDWINRVYANGGTVSTSTANAVDAFCNAIDAAGIRDRFYRLNLFAGTGLNAALVPLYRGPTFGGTTYGNSTDTNVNFVSGDYVESSGLTGTGNNGVGVGNSKHLRTGLAQQALASSNLHLSAFVFDLTTTGATQQTFLGIRSTASPANRWWLEYRGSISTELGGNGVGFGAVTGATGDSLISVSRESSTLLRPYVNGTQFGSDITTDITASLANRNFDWAVFAANIDGGINQYCNFTMGMYSIGDAMTAAQQASLYSAMTAFNAAMGRS